MSEFEPWFGIGPRPLNWPLFRAYADLARKHRMRYIGPFTVTRVVGDNAVELKGLPDRMPKVLNTEYVHLYKRDDDPRLAELRQSPLLPRPQIRDNDDEEFPRH